MGEYPLATSIKSIFQSGGFIGMISTLVLNMK